MKTSLKAGFAQIFPSCPKNLSYPKFGEAAAPLAPPDPYAYGLIYVEIVLGIQNYLKINLWLLYHLTLPGNFYGSARDFFAG